MTKLELFELLNLHNLYAYKFAYNCVDWIAQIVQVSSLSVGLVYEIFDVI